MSKTSWIVLAILGAVGAGYFFFVRAKQSSTTSSTTDNSGSNQTGAPLAPPGDTNKQDADKLDTTNYIWDPQRHSYVNA